MDLEKLAINDLKNRLKSAVFWNRQIITLNEEIETINYILEGTSTKELKFDNIQNEPDIRAMHRHRIHLYDKQAKLIKEVEKFEMYFKELEVVLNKIPKDIRDAIIRVYVFNENQEQVAREMFWERTTLLYNIDKCLSKSLRLSTLSVY